MSLNHQFRQKKLKSTLATSNLIDAWKVRPILGFEKDLFSNIQSSVKSQRKPTVDPARIIYPRDAMGNLLSPLGNGTTLNSIPFYLPKYDSTKIRSPIWTIKNVHQMKRNTLHVNK